MSEKRPEAHSSVQKMNSAALLFPPFTAGMTRVHCAGFAGPCNPDVDPWSSLGAVPYYHCFVVSKLPSRMTLQRKPATANVCGGCQPGMDPARRRFSPVQRPRNIVLRFTCRRQTRQKHGSSPPAMCLNPRGTREEGI